MAGASWALPTSANIGDQDYQINTDYRDILYIIEKMNSDLIWAAKQKVLIALFYCDYEKMPSHDYEEAIRYLFDFVACGEENDGRAHPKQIDWEQDKNIIAAEINKIAGHEVRAVPYLHWFTFIGYFMAIGEGQLSYLVGIRHKLSTGKKLTKDEREFYIKNKSRVTFKTQYTDDEIAEKDALLKMLDGKER